jgi:hypothetical protein
MLAFDLAYSPLSDASPQGDTMRLQGDFQPSQSDAFSPQGDASAAQGYALAHKATKTLLDTVPSVPSPTHSAAWTIRNARWSNPPLQAKNKP